MISLPAAVADAWNIRGDIEPLDGGQGTSVRAGGLVFKPQPDQALVVWHAGLCDRVTTAAFRLPAPVRSDDGRLVVDAWYATQFVDGDPIPAGDASVVSWMKAVTCSRDFHTAVAGEHRPALLDARTDHWAVADRAAWDEGDPPEIGQRSAGLLRRTRGFVVDEGLTPQLVHGDLSGNVLFAEGLPPAVIDLSPYWRPAEYADAIVVDPPSFAQRQHEADRALAAYSKLTTLAVRLLRPGGLLVQCSCSSRVTAEQFHRTVALAASRAGRPFDEIRRTAHAVDHPVRFTEGAYLKAVFARVP